MPECTFLLPLALTIFGFSTSVAESERFSVAAAATGVDCSFFCFGALLPPEGFGGPSALETTGFSIWSDSAAGVDGFGSFAFASSGSVFVGFSGSAIIYFENLNFARFCLGIPNHANG